MEPLPTSPLVATCLAIRDHLQAKVQPAAASTLKVVVGTLAAAAPSGSDATSYLNLFFHRFEPAQCGADIQSSDVQWLRVHLIVTPFATAEGGFTAGENDLHLVGEALRVFHEKPVLTLSVPGWGPLQVQLVPQPLSLDDINRLWSTQRDVTYRPSLVYEVVLVPVPPLTPLPPPLLVGTVDAKAEVKTGSGQSAPSEERQPSLRGAFPGGQVMIAQTHWAPLICFADETAGAASPALLQIVAIPFGSLELHDWQPAVVVAGAPGEAVELCWSAWESNGWVAVEPRGQSTLCTGPGLWPRDVMANRLVPVARPVPQKPVQLLLHAERTYSPPDGAPPLKLKSNSLRVIVYASTDPPSGDGG